jgi:hypothetical protein
MSFIYIQCPSLLHHQYLHPEYPLVFVAGGISNCPDWQDKFCKRFVGDKILLINPRSCFPSEEQITEEEQITWEYSHIQNACRRTKAMEKRPDVACAISFWFTSATVQPTSLLELGKATIIAEKLFVGVDPDYEWKLDVEIQVGLERPEVKIVYSLDDLEEQIRNWAKEKSKKPS